MIELYFSHTFFAGVLILPEVRRKIRQNGGKIYKIKDNTLIRIDVKLNQKESLLSILSTEYGVEPEKIIEPVSTS